MTRFLLPVLLLLALSIPAAAETIGPESYTVNPNSFLHRTISVQASPPDRVISLDALTVTQPASGFFDVYLVTEGDFQSSYPSGAFTPIETVGNPPYENLAIEEWGAAGLSLQWIVPANGTYVLLIDNTDNARPTDGVPDPYAVLSGQYQMTVPNAPPGPGDNNPPPGNGGGPKTSPLPLGTLFLVAVVVVTLVVFILVLLLARKKPPTPAPVYPSTAAPWGTQPPPSSPPPPPPSDGPSPPRL